MDPSSAFSADMLQQLMNPRDPAATIRKLMSIGDANLLGPMIDKVDLLKFGGDLLQAACAQGKKDMVELLMKKGADIMNPPDSISGEDSYRRSPFIIQAASSGDVDTLMFVLDNGGAIADCGFVTLSKKRKNQVISNVVGCAAWFGRKKMLEYCLKRLDKSYLEQRAKEVADIHAKGSFTKELSRYTPLMLTVAKGDENLDCLKVLLQHDANFLAKDEYNNGLLHIAALNGNNKMLDYLSKNLKIDIFERNSKGETALNICQTLKNQAGVEILEKFAKECDNSKALANDLLDELMKEEEHGEEAKAKRKQKKWRNKINKIAKAEGITTEEVEKRLAMEDELKKEEEIRLRKEQEEKEARAAAEEKRRKEELRKLREAQLKAEEEEEERERIRVVAEEREAREARQRAAAEKKERYRSQARQAAEKDRPQRNKSRQRQPEVEQSAEEKPSLRKERVKQERSDEKPRQVRESREGRHQNANPTPAQRASSKSQRRNENENQIEVDQTLAGEKHIFGLGGQMRLETATSKKAQQRMRRKLQKEEEEAKEQKATMERVGREKQEAKDLQEKEERKRLNEEKKQERLRKQKEKAEKKKAEQEEEDNQLAAEAEVKAAAQAELQNEKEKDTKAKKSKNKRKDAKEDAKLVYRPKNPSPKEETKEPEAQAEPTAQAPAVEAEAPKKKEKAKRERKEYQPKAASKPEAVPEPAPVVEAAPVVVASPVQPASPPKAKKSVKKEESAGKPAAANSQVASLQQLLLSKENEIVKLQKYIDKQEKKSDEVRKENDQLRDQLKLSSNDSQLKQTISELNDSLRKQTSLNKLQALQILEFEQSLWQANKQREEAEEKLYEVQNGQSAPTPDSADSVQQELRVKSVQLRDLQSQVEQYQGKATIINSYSRTQLIDLQDDLNQSLQRVQIAMTNTVKK